MTSTTVDEDGIQNTVSTDGSTLVPTAKTAEQHNEYIPNKPIGIWDDKVHTGEGQFIAEEFTDALQQYIADYIVRNAGDSENAQYVVCYIPADHTVDPPEHVPKHFMTCYWSRMKKEDKRQQWQGWARVNRWEKVRK